MHEHRVDTQRVGDPAGVLTTGTVTGTPLTTTIQMIACASAAAQNSRFGRERNASM